MSREMSRDGICRQPCPRRRRWTFSSTVAASSNSTAGRCRGRSRNFSNSRSLVQYQVSPRQTMSLPWLCEVVFADLLRAGHVEKGLRVSVELLNLWLAHAVAFAAGIIPAKRPAVSESVRFQRGQHRFNVSARVRRQVVEAGVVNPASGVFDIIGVVTKPAQAHEVMQKLKRDARQRVPEQNPGDDDFAL